MIFIDFGLPNGSQIPDPIPRLNLAWGGFWERAWAPKRGPFFQLFPYVGDRSDESLPALPALPALPEASPRARLEPYFPRACPQDDVSSTRQTPSNNLFVFFSSSWTQVFMLRDSTPGAGFICSPIRRSSLKGFLLVGGRCPSQGPGGSPDIPDRCP